MKTTKKLGIVLALFTLCSFLLITSCAKDDSVEKEITTTSEETTKEEETTRFNENVPIIPPSPNIEITHTHVYGDWETIKQVSCTNNGEERRYCGCGEVQSKIIPKIDHQSYKVVRVSEPSCDEDGIEESQCEKCGYVRSTRIIPALGHAYPYYGEIKKLAGCTTEGVQVFVCTRSTCNSSYEGKLEPTGHSYSKSNVYASCETPGGIEYSCKNCSHSYFEETSDPIGSHSLEVNGICSRCKKNFSVDMTTRVSGPLSGTKYGFSFSNGSCMLWYSWQATNISQKTIRYCTFQYRCYDSAGGLLATKTVKITGPISSNGTINGDHVAFGDAAYITAIGDNVYKLEISHIMLEYTDGTVEAGKYGYATTKVNDAMGGLYG